MTVADLDVWTHGLLVYNDMRVTPFLRADADGPPPTEIPFTQGRRLATGVVVYLQEGCEVFVSDLLVTRREVALHNGPWRSDVRQRLLDDAVRQHRSFRQLEFTEALVVGGACWRIELVGVWSRVAELRARLTDAEANTTPW